MTLKSLAKYQQVALI